MVLENTACFGGYGGVGKVRARHLVIPYLRETPWLEQEKGRYSLQVADGHPDSGGIMAPSSIDSRLESYLFGCSLIDELSGLTRASPPAAEPIRFLLDRLGELEPFPQEVSSYYARFQKSVTEEGLLEPPEVLSERCREMRLALTASYLSINASPQAAGSGLEGALKVGTVVHSYGGIAYAVVNETATVLLPPLRTGDSLADLTRGLADVYESCGMRYSWLVDFSDVNDVPHLLIGSFVGHRKYLAQSGKEIYLAWLRDGVVPPVAMKSLKEIFNLESHAGHWFSKSLMRGMP